MLGRSPASRPQESGNLLGGVTGQDGRISCGNSPLPEVLVAMVGWAEVAGRAAVRNMSLMVGGNDVVCRAGGVENRGSGSNQGDVEGRDR